MSVGQNEKVLPPGSTIGILGGGQLGRMTALSAACLGYRVHVFAPEADSPAGDVAARTTTAAWDDTAALDRFADAVDVVTLEFENVPVAAIEHLAGRVPVRPGADVLRVTQDRVIEKSAINDLGIVTANWVAVDDETGARSAATAFPGTAILKTRRMGYDGKGQMTCETPEDVPAAWEQLGRVPCILEQRIALEREISVIVARSPSGEEAAFPPVENLHRNHILAETRVPAAVPDAISAKAGEIALAIARGLDCVGLIAVEMFIDRDGRILVNELAPRPHNSGHWSIDGCETSQFEQQVRAICNLPLGRTEPIGRCRMENLLGEEADRWLEILRQPGAHLHLYGKRESRPGRKMGHVTFVERG